MVLDIGAAGVRGDQGAVRSAWPAYDRRMIPALSHIDHVHVYVADRAVAEPWYREVLGFQRSADLLFWATDGGPLTLQNASGSIHLALFERAVAPCRSTIALACSAAEFLRWRAHLQGVLSAAPETSDHQVSWSLYFADPDGNPYEITSYDYRDIKAALQAPQA